MLFREGRVPQRMTSVGSEQPEHVGACPGCTGTALTGHLDVRTSPSGKQGHRRWAES